MHVRNISFVYTCIAISPSNDKISRYINLIDMQEYNT